MGLAGFNAMEATGEWCGCKAGPKGCARPCAGCCGGDEAVCFSGMDPTGGGLRWILRSPLIRALDAAAPGISG